jgi:DNA-binding protein H-NS
MKLEFNPKIVDDLPLRSLLSLNERLGKAIAQAKDRERDTVKAEMAKFAEQRGFHLNELVGKAKSHKKRHARHAYVNPENPIQRWTGMGRKPNWLVDKLAKGSHLDQFRAG